MKPVLYQDVDGVLLQFPPHRTKEWWEKNAVEGCVAAEGAGEFLLWAVKHFEVRWLTAWCTRGYMFEDSAERLSTALKVPFEVIADIHNDLGWRGNKTQGINWEEHEEGRPWVWLDDECSPEERKVLKEHNAVRNLWYVDTSLHSKSLIRALDDLKRWNLSVLTERLTKKWDGVLNAKPWQEGDPVPVIIESQSKQLV